MGVSRLPVPPPAYPTVRSLGVFCLQKYAKALALRKAQRRLQVTIHDMWHKLQIFDESRPNAIKGSS